MSYISDTTKFCKCVNVETLNKINWLSVMFSNKSRNWVNIPKQWKICEMSHFSDTLTVCNWNPKSVIKILTSAEC